LSLSWSDTLVMDDNLCHDSRNDDTHLPSL
jgi:hypothetical protein